MRQTAVERSCDECGETYWQYAGRMRCPACLRAAKARLEDAKPPVTAGEMSARQANLRRLIEFAKANALDVSCPKKHCWAPAGEPCKTLSAKKLRHPHMPRVHKFAKRAQAPKGSTEWWWVPSRFEKSVCEKCKEPLVGLFAFNAYESRCRCRACAEKAGLKVAMSRAAKELDVPPPRSPRAVRVGNFERMAEADAAMAVSHRLKTRFDGAYRPVCSCGWVGESFDDRGDAVQAGVGHTG